MAHSRVKVVLHSGLRDWAAAGGLNLVRLTISNITKSNNLSLNTIVTNFTTEMFLKGKAMGNYVITILLFRLKESVIA